jgi:hypothetical protein
MLGVQHEWYHRQKSILEANRAHMSCLDFAAQCLDWRSGVPTTVADATRDFMEKAIPWIPESLR